MNRSAGHAREAGTTVVPALTVSPALSPLCSPPPGAVDRTRTARVPRASFAGADRRPVHGLRAYRPPDEWTEHPGAQITPRDRLEPGGPHVSVETSG